MVVANMWCLCHDAAHTIESNWTCSSTRVRLSTRVQFCIKSQDTLALGDDAGQSSVVQRVLDAKARDPVQFTSRLRKALGADDVRDDAPSDASDASGASDASPHSSHASQDLEGITPEFERAPLVLTADAELDDMLFVSQQQRDIGFSVDAGKKGDTVELLYADKFSDGMPLALLGGYLMLEEDFDAGIALCGGAQARASKQQEQQREWRAMANMYSQRLALPLWDEEESGKEEQRAGAGQGLVLSGLGYGNIMQLVVGCVDESVPTCAVSVPRHAPCLLRGCDPPQLTNRLVVSQLVIIRVMGVPLPFIVFLTDGASKRTSAEHGRCLLRRRGAKYSVEGAAQASLRPKPH